MKKLILIIFGIISVLNLHSESVRINSKADFIGMTKQTNTYAKQSIQNSPKEFYLGWNTSKTSYGRGYLQFDLSKIPSGSEITYVSIELKCSSGANSPYFSTKRKVSVKEVGLYLYPDEQIWNFLASGSPLGAFDIGWGNTVSFQADQLKQLTKSRIGNTLYLSLNMNNEGELVMLSGEPTELYLYVEYKAASSGGGGSDPNTTCGPIEVTHSIEGLVNMSGPTVVRSNSTFTYRANPSVKLLTLLGEPYYYYYWSGSADKLETECLYGERWGVDCNWHWVKYMNAPGVQSRQFSVIKDGPAVIRFCYYGEGSKYYGNEVNIYIIPNEQLIVPDKSVVCNNETFSCSISNLIGIEKIEWISGTYTTLISGQGSSKATFNATGNGFANIKAKITFPNGAEYIIENNNVWVGIPKSHTIQGLSPGGLNPSSSYTLSVYAIPGFTYSWNALAGGKIIGSNTGSRIEFQTNYVPINNKTSIYNVYVYTENVCGKGPFTSANGYLLYPMYHNEAAAATPTAIPDISSTTTIPKSIKIYSISGAVVYTSKSSEVNVNIKNIGLPPGIYIVETTNEDGDITRKKVILDK